MIWLCSAHRSETVAAWDHALPPKKVGPFAPADLQRNQTIGVDQVLWEVILSKTGKQRMLPNLCDRLGIDRFESTGIPDSHLNKEGKPKQRREAFSCTTSGTMADPQRPTKRAPDCEDHASHWASSLPLKDIKFMGTVQYPIGRRNDLSYF